ncbi:N-acetylglucosamine-6-phosphate deacetylase [Evansella caseinilytica]|uniref:N-acetylglucosamine-6-phosphate deacetylase n=1 Tax=Evansella caseinilytica TaxID=1503961 RepID=A0A1H3QGP1_9BACI|nr:N-acetylglucosamine-6-phosphate deacetylase [Evansella caseinilytica]SDZ11879.1 N-acetylglucosamine-6-phosphate deacetylase [Evansella caseinilytica]
MRKLVMFKNAVLFAEEGWIEEPFVEIEGKRIKSYGKINDLEMERRHSAECYEYDERVYIVPGFIDIHIHGAGNGDAMDGTDEALQLIQSTLPAEGTTAFLATTITQSVAQKRTALSKIKEVMSRQSKAGAQIVGVHLEGPFISAKRAGAQPLQHIRKPKLSLFHEFQEAAADAIKLVTLAPEEENGLELVRELKKTGVVASIGHSDATYEQVVEALKAGVTHATHLFNGMRGIHHRDIGVAGGVLLHKELTAELIVDGIHVSPAMVRLVYQTKGADGIIIITDSLRAKGLTDGVYQLGGQDVTVKNNRAVLQDGTLAGSIIKMNNAVRNMMTFSGCSFEEAVQMATSNPAAKIGIDDHKGSIKAGKDADFVVVDKDVQVKQTFILGKRVF